MNLLLSLSPFLSRCSIALFPRRCSIALRVCVRRDFAVSGTFYSGHFADPLDSPCSIDDEAKRGLVRKQEKPREIPHVRWVNNIRPAPPPSFSRRFRRVVVADRRRK